MTKRKKYKYPLAEIVWRDAASMAEGWETLAEIDVADELVVTVGFQVKETDLFYVIAHTYSSDDDSTNGRIKIPKAMVQEYKIISGAKNGTS